MDRLYRLFDNNYSANVLQYLQEDLGFSTTALGAENTDIVDNMLDYITVAQAFHLFQNTETLRELKRILKPDGRLIII